MALTQQDIEPILNDLTDWLSNENINGLSVGRKKVSGKETGQLAVIVKVEKKKPLSRLNQDDIPIPPEVELHIQSPDGAVTSHKVPTDVVEVGVLRLCALDKKVRPTPGGYQIAVSTGFFSDDSTGTLGANIVYQGTYRLLTNNHVIANNGNVGAKVYQPAPGVFGGNDLTTVTGYTPVITYPNKSQNNPTYNRTDLAWCDITTNEGAAGIVQIGTPTGLRAPQLTEQVQWIGKKTAAVQQTAISSTKSFVKMPFSNEWAWFRDVIEFSGGSVQQGDSGSAIVAASDMNIVGLIFGTDKEGGGMGCVIP